MASRFKKTFLLLLLLLTGVCIKHSSAQSVGVLYGLSYRGGSINGGTLFSYDPITGKDTTLVNFNSTVTGYSPNGSLVQASNGLLYGLASTGGANNDGTLFSYNISANSFSSLFSFNSTSGTTPYGTLMQASDGKLYGMTTYGGTHNDGTLFSYDLVSGQFDTLVNFDSLNGKWPFYEALVQAPNGHLYGTTGYGGTSNEGVLFSYDPITKKDSVIINFIDSVGVYPYGGPILASNGNIYGMTYGTPSKGIIYSYNPVTTKDTFFLSFNTADGFFHNGGLLQGTNGLLYGLQTHGGNNNDGTLFSFNISSGKDTQLISFNTPSGSFPFSAPIQASNGLLYGLTSNGGSYGSGTIFGYTISTGKDSVLINLGGTDNVVNPFGNLLEAFTYTITGNDSVNCFGDSAGWAKISTRGGKMPITYLWSNGSTIDSIGDLKAGAYTCQVTDLSGKTLLVTVNIIQPQLFLANALVENDCLGNNDSGWVSPTGGTPPYTFLWNNGYTKDTLRGMPPGIDSCHITDAHGCTQLGILTFANAAPLKIDSVVSTRPSCLGCSNGTATVYVSGGIPPGDSNVPGYTLIYLWTYGGDSAKVHGIPSGVDSVTVTNECGSVVGFTDVPLSINTLNMPDNEVKIYPVPSSGQITLAMHGNGFENIAVVDELGRKVYGGYLDASLYNYTLHADLSDQPNGIYIVQLLTEKGIITRKLVIEK